PPQVTDQRLQSRGEVRGPVNVVSASNLTKSQQVWNQHMTVIQNSFSNEDSPAGEDTGEKTATAMSMQTAADPTLTQTADQFYVMMTPSDVLHSASQLTLAPRTHMYTHATDERRRAQHNEVERRRRDKINNWIVALSKIIPDCSIDGTKTGASKGGILSKACDYIGELKQHNQRLQESLRGVERVQMDNELLRQLNQHFLKDIFPRNHIPLF
uniref:BHLH domain-containing protein n=1 Tax=Sinocyclocheilus anshuiensis TaxID=1608454 RepID=A0A671KQ84_9TELE